MTKARRLSGGPFHGEQGETSPYQNYLRMELKARLPGYSAVVSN